MPPSETDGGVAPVIPMFAQGERPQGRSPRARGERSFADTDAAVPDESVDDGAAVNAEIAERTLLRRLRTRSLSVSEARRVASERDPGSAQIDELLDRFQRLGYLDDAALAEQLVYTGVERKGQGRRVVAQTLAARGIPRDIAEAALAQMPDDDRERAVEFARSRARSLTSVDRDTALRRLSGQLARRGYGGSVAFDAARQALDELGA